jgi:hypothetical protein
VFHVDLLTPYVETDFHGPNYMRPPPDLIDGEEEYEVKSILKSRRYGRGRNVTPRLAFVQLGLVRCGCNRI